MSAGSTAVTAVTTIDFTAAGPNLPLLVLGPSLGTSAAALWSVCAGRLRDIFHIIAWDLPGHGTNRPTSATTQNNLYDVSIESLAAGVLERVDEVLARRGDTGGSFIYAGDSVGGAVGLQLLLDAPGRISSAVLLCTGATIGDPQAWRDRAITVCTEGTEAVVEAAKARWFSPGWLDREPEPGLHLLQALRDADRLGYAQVCEALANFDVRARLAEITTPVLAVAGADDIVTPVANLREIADHVGDGWLLVLDQVGHLAPAEAPEEVAKLLQAQTAWLQPRLQQPILQQGRPEQAGPEQAGPEQARSAQARSAQARSAQARSAGMSVRREVLGAEHVDRVTATTTDLTREFQEFITQYAWGGIWTRPGLDRRSRSMITLTALVARGHHEELALHVRAARTNGLSNDEIKELLLQTAIYCGVPDANTAFRIAQQVLDQLDHLQP